MTESERRLAAILSADVVGYSRLMAEDEDATVRTVTAYREQVGSLVREHRGRLVDFSGDNFLAEFRSALEAVRCAIEIQRVLAARNADLPPERKMEFRIGAHLGDVRVEGKRIYGDGVNIAARLEGLAEAGGICISGPIRDQVRNKLRVLIEDLGEQTLKNIPEPVRVYRLRLGERREGAAAGSAPRTTSDKPSIAVLPFANMSGDPEQEYFADGITEDLITGLSKISGLVVIARTSSFAYKGKAVNVKEIAHELDVKHLLEGSVRKGGNRVRITAQLIEAASGHHLWAERYDRKLEDIFDVQDEVTAEIVETLKVRLAQGESVTRERPPTANMEAYDLYLRGYSYVMRISPESNRRARETLERAIALDPDFAAPYSALAITYLFDWMQGWDQRPENMKRGYEIAKKAVQIDDRQSIPHAMLATVLTFMGNSEKAIEEARSSVRLNPNEPIAIRALANSLSIGGRPREAIAAAEEALRVDPHDPMGAFILGEALYLSERFEEAVPWLKRAQAGIPTFDAPFMYLAAAYEALGEAGKARQQVTEARRITPGYRAEDLVRRVPYKDRSTLERLIERLRKAGMN